MVRRALAAASGPGAAAAVPADDQAPMFSLRVAATVAALLTGMQALVHGLKLWLGDAGLLAGSMLAALLDLHAAAAAVMVQGPADRAGLGALMLAMGVHAMSKLATGWLSGGVAYARALAPGLLIHTAGVIGLLAWRGLP